MENEEKVRNMMKNQGKVMENDEKLRKIMKNQRKILENEEKVRKNEGKPMKNQGKVMENKEKVRKPCPRPKKIKFPKQEKKFPKKFRTLVYLFLLLCMLMYFAAIKSYLDRGS
jgi:hypothetical protein